METSFLHQMQIASKLLKTSYQKIWVWRMQKLLTNILNLANDINAQK